MKIIYNDGHVEECPKDEELHEKIKEKKEAIEEASKNTPKKPTNDPDSDPADSSNESTTDSTSEVPATTPSEGVRFAETAPTSGVAGVRVRRTANNSIKPVAVDGKDAHFLYSSIMSVSFPSHFFVFLKR